MITSNELPVYIQPYRQPAQRRLAGHVVEAAGRYCTADAIAATGLTWPAIRHVKRRSLPRPHYVVETR